MPSGSLDQITVYGTYGTYSDLDHEMLLAARQRVTFCYHRETDGWKRYHMHVSNPWSQVSGDEVFPDEISRETYEYLQECIAAQKAQIEEQTALLERLSFEDDLTGLFNRNRYNQVAKHYEQAGLDRLGVACFDLNGLKSVNDHLCHVAGDQLIRRSAHLIKQCFPGKTYRFGGDEFVVIDAEADEDAFLAALDVAKQQLDAEQIGISVGVSWRAAPCDMEAQLDEADRRMYQERNASAPSVASCKYAQKDAFRGALFLFRQPGAGTNARFVCGRRVFRNFLSLSRKSDRFRLDKPPAV